MMIVNDGKSTEFIILQILFFPHRSHRTKPCDGKTVLDSIDSKILLAAWKAGEGQTKSEKWTKRMVIPNRNRKGPAGNRTQVGGIRTLSDNQLHYRAFRLCCLREVFLSLSTLALTCRLVLIAETEYSTKKSLTSVRKNGVGSDVLI